MPLSLYYLACKRELYCYTIGFPMITTPTTNARCSSIMIDEANYVGYVNSL